MFDEKLFSSRLKMLRLTRDASRTEIARETGIPLSSLGNYERGDKTPNADIIEKLCRFYNISADYLLGISDNERSSEWPKAVPVVAVESIEKIKHAVESMISSVCLSAYGIHTLRCYAEVIESLTTIDDLAVKKLHELKLEYPDFKHFGAEMQMQFNGVSVIMALANGDEDAITFAKRLTDVTEEIRSETIWIADRIKDIISVAFGAITNPPTENAVYQDIQSIYTEEHQAREEYEHRTAHSVIEPENDDKEDQ